MRQQLVSTRYMEHYIPLYGVRLYPVIWSKVVKPTSTELQNRFRVYIYIFSFKQHFFLNI